MKKFSCFVSCFILLSILPGLGFSSTAKAAPKGEPILIGVPVSMGVVFGQDVKEAIALAIKEINAAGGVNVGGQKRPFKMIIGETRAMEPGVPITEALLAVERLIAHHNVDFLVGGPIRSEACFAARPLTTQYKKVAIITVGCYSPRYGDAKKYPYAFRIQGDITFEIPKVQMKLLSHVRDKFGFNKMYIIVQDVKHARAAGNFVEKLGKKAGFEIVGKDVYPTGSTDFSLALLAVKKKGAQLLYIWMDMPELTILAKQYYDMKLPALPIGFPSAATDLEWSRMTEGKGEYFVADLLWAGRSKSDATPWTGTS